MVCKNRLHTLFKKDFKSQKNVNFQNCEFEIIYEKANYHQHFYPLQKVHFSVLPLSNGTFFIFTPCKWDIFYFYPFEMGHFFYFYLFLMGHFFLFLPLLNGTFLFLSFMNETFSIFKQCVFRSFRHHNLSKILIS